MAAKRGRWKRVLVVGAVLSVVALVAAIWIGRGLGRWLVIEEPLQPARAIVVLAGGWPFRAMEAADLFHQGAAPEVWLTTEAADGQTEAVMERLGVEIHRSGDYDYEILQRLGVSREAIRRLPERVRNTEEELRIVAGHLADTGGDRVIVVSSKSHSRRVRVIWNAVAPAEQAIVRHSRAEPFDPGRWWASTDDAADVIYELAALLNAWAGFPLQPK